MSLKLQYDPKKNTKLRQNEMLNEFRVQLSQRIYELFKRAENDIWNKDDYTFSFVDTLSNQLSQQLDQVTANLKSKAQAWEQAALMNNSDNNKILIRKTNSSINQNEAQNAHTQQAHPASIHGAIRLETSPIQPRKPVNSQSTAKPFLEDEFDFIEDMF